MPEATVAAIIIKKDAEGLKVLLTRRRGKPFVGRWCLPGGHIERFEPNRAAVAREVKEETGLEFAPLFFGHFDEMIPELDIHAVVLVYEGTASGLVKAEEREVSEIAWFPLEEARSLPLAFLHNEILDNYAVKVSQAG